MQKVTLQVIRNTKVKTRRTFSFTKPFILLFIFSIIDFINTLTHLLIHSSIHSCMHKYEDLALLKTLSG